MKFLSIQGRCERSRRQRFQQEGKQTENARTRKPSGFQVKQCLCPRTQRGADTSYSAPERGEKLGRVSRKSPKISLEEQQLEERAALRAGDGWDVTAVPPPEQLQAGADGTLGSLWDEGNLHSSSCTHTDTKRIGKSERK